VVSIGDYGDYAGEKMVEINEANFPTVVAFTVADRFVVGARGTADEPMILADVATALDATLPVVDMGH